MGERKDTRKSSDRINFILDKEEKRRFKARLAREGSTITEKIKEWIKEYTR